MNYHFLLFIPMSLYVRDAPEPIPPDQVSLWVQQAFITTCLNVMLTTLVVYDAGTLSSHSHEQTLGKFRLSFSLHDG